VLVFTETGYEEFIAHATKGGKASEQNH
jgi:hypothetical protein